MAMEVEKDIFGEDEEEPREALDQTGFLLQRLQELKAWQKEQEMKLLRDQQEQIEKLKANGGNDADEDFDDDATIDQDVSSLTSFEETPNFGNPYSSNFEEEYSDELPVRPQFNPETSTLPSWASRTESGTGSNEPKTVINNGDRNGSLAKNRQHERMDRESVDSGSKPVLNFDEKPITAPKKTFEELLAEQLGTDIAPETLKNESPQTPAFVKRSPPTRAKSFLRKGSGLARYGGVGSPPKGFRRSVSQNNVKDESGTPVSIRSHKIKPSTSCSGLNIANRETIAFASKKSPPKRVAKPPAKSLTNSPVKVQQNGSKAKFAKPQNPVKVGKKALPSGIPPVLRLKKNQPPAATEVARIDHSEDEASTATMQDSVEHSFREKLKKAGQNHERELEDLATFEMLEEAACDSSFCSSSSKVKTLMENIQMPKPKLATNGKSVTSTPKQVRSSKMEDESNLAPKLMNDIQTFLENRGAVITNDDDDEGEEGFSSLSDTESEDHTLKNDDRHPIRVGGGFDGDTSDIENYDSDDWCSVDSAESGANQQNRVHFDDKDQVMNFSPPRMPKNAPSYLIWSIFTKEREERRRKKSSSANLAERQNGKHTNGNARSFSPLSKVKLKRSTSNNDVFHSSSLLNSKLAELEKEIEKFRHDNIALQNGRRKLNADRKKLAEEVAELEKAKEVERKKAEEERRRSKRDRVLLEKAQKERKTAEERKLVEEAEDVKAKCQKLQEDMERKEAKWAAALSKLQEQVKYLERENQILHEENHRLKLKGVAPKISTKLSDITSGRKENNKKPEVVNLKESNNIRSPDSGFRSNPDAPTSVASNNGLETDKAAAKEFNTPRFDFSPADSLESSVTLVSGVHTSEAVSTARGQPATKSMEKRHPDGTLEIRYPNGNKKLITADGKATKMHYYNGDFKETLPSGLVKYFYSQTKTWHLTYPDKKEVLQFDNGQEEIRYPDGSLQITFPDGSIKKISIDGAEDMSFPDGTRVEVDPKGDRTLHLSNGRKEIHTSDFKRHEYPDGTVKILFNDGKMETRYANGRVRIKDGEGRLLHDSHQTSNKKKT